MRTYTPYCHKLNALLGKVALEIFHIFKEHNATEIHLNESVRLTFSPRYAGDVLKTCEIDTIICHNMMIHLCSKDDNFCLYDLSNKVDIAFVYDIIYQHFYNNENDTSRI